MDISAVLTTLSENREEFEKVVLKNLETFCHQNKYVAFCFRNESFALSSEHSNKVPIEKNELAYILLGSTLDFILSAKEVTKDEIILMLHRFICDYLSSSMYVFKRNQIEGKKNDKIIVFHVSSLFSTYLKVLSDEEKAAKLE